MTGRAKGRLALVGLGVVVLGFGVALATSRAGRIRYLAWRMHSSDREVRLAARTRLMEIGRPAIDGVFADVVAGEVCDRLVAVPSSERLVFVERSESVIEVSSEGRPCHSVKFQVDLQLTPPRKALTYSGWSDPVPDALGEALGPSSGTVHRRLVVGALPGPGGPLSNRLLVELALDDPLARSVIEETRSRLDSMR